MRKYEKPILRIEQFADADIITSSSEYELPIAPGDNGTELPIIPATLK